jgi:nifR3 family TIM-barrel protein
MALGFWSKLKKPITALAPMANVTDAAFRRMFVECGLPRATRPEGNKEESRGVSDTLGRPSIFWTEFVSAEGLLSRGKEKLLVDLWYEKREHPIVAQVFGGKPEQFERVGPLIRELGFDGIDINMGCPDAGVEKSGGGAALMKKPELAKEIIRAVKRGAGNLPVSVKTRLGYVEDESATWIPALLEEDIAALTVHFRTRKEMSDVPAHWEIAPSIVAMRDRIAPQTILLGNGDVNTFDEIATRTKKSGFDGVMVGRAAFGNPWFFLALHSLGEGGSGYTPTVRERLERMILHAELFEQLYKCNTPGRLKGFEVMKKHFKAYCSGFDDAKELRTKLMVVENAAEVRKIIQNYFRDE